jgi:hypothetical protein
VAVSYSYALCILASHLCVLQLSSTYCITSVCCSYFLHTESSPCSAIIFYILCHLRVLQLSSTYCIISVSCSYLLHTVSSLCPTLYSTYCIIYVSYIIFYVLYHLYVLEFSSTCIMCPTIFISILYHHCVLQFSSTYGTNFLTDIYLTLTLSSPHFPILTILYTLKYFSWSCKATITFHTIEAAIYILDPSNRYVEVQLFIFSNYPGKLKNCALKISHVCFFL